MSFIPPAIPAIAGAAASVAQIGLSGAQAYSSIKAGQAQKKALEQQAKARELQGKYLDIQMDQTAAASREELSSTLATITAVRAQRGTMASADSAITKEVSRRARRGERINLLGLSADKTALLNEIQSLRAAKTPALLAGIAGAASPLIDAGNALGRLIPKKKPQPEETA